MSVLMLGVDIFPALYTKMLSYSFNKQCDINYCSSASRLFDRGEAYVKGIVKTWCDLNELSYNCRYKKEPNPTPLSYFIDFNKSPFPAINTYQFLKYLHFLRYQIEISTIKEVRDLTTGEHEAFEILEKIIKEVRGIIIGLIPEYMEAKLNEI